MLTEIKKISVPITSENYEALREIVKAKKVSFKKFIENLLIKEIMEFKSENNKKDINITGLLPEKELKKYIITESSAINKVKDDGIITTNDDMGVSEYTPIKEALFKQLLTRQINIIRAINNKYGENNIFNIYDINAGSGEFTLQNRRYNGSPLVILNEVAQYPGVLFNILFYELNKQSCKKLQTYLDQKTYQDILTKDNISCTILNTDHNVIDSYFQKIEGVTQFGCIYNDANGMPNFDLLKKISNYQQSKKLDIFINCNTTIIKRTRRVAEGKIDGYTKSNDSNLKTLEELLCGINKSHWIIRKPEMHTGWRWTFLIGTNWAGKNSLPSPHCDFYTFTKNYNNKLVPNHSNKLKNTEAKEILRSINLTEDELNYK